MNSSKSLDLTPATVRANYLAVLEKASEAAVRAGRTPGDIRVIGVTKYVDSEATRALVAAGCTELGESRPQVLWEKAAALQDLPIHWHLIGHLQRNKAKRTLPLVSTMHSLDSLRLLQQIEQDIGERDRPLQLLLEINVSGDADKTGLPKPEAEALLDYWCQKSEGSTNLQISGLMGMGSLEGGRERARQDFIALRLLRDEWVTRFGMPLADLSMGMSDDFEIAIEEGATMVRVGSILFAPA